MTRKHQQRRGEHWSRYGFQNLLGWFFVYLVIGPFLESLPFAKHILNAILTIVLVSALVATSESRKLQVGVAALLAITVLLMWLRSTGVYSPRVDLGSSALACFLMPLFTFSITAT